MSRRERPAKPALTRAGIIAAAVEILEHEGLGKVTMRRIATALDTGAASLYVYVRDTGDLHSGVLDALLGRLPTSASAGTWNERLHDVLGKYAALLVEYPEIARTVMTTPPAGPHYYAMVDLILGLLREGGASDAQAAWGINLLLASVAATAVEHGGVDPVDEAATLAVLGSQIAAAPSSSYPNIARLGGDLVSGSSDERFSWSLDVLINGLMHTPRTMTP